MKINFINNFKKLMNTQIDKTQAVTGLAILTATGAACLVGTACKRPCIKESKKEHQEYVQKYNPIMYEELNNGQASYNVWKQAAEQVKDSLYIDSIAKTNYAKGMQAVRDSIAKANQN